MSKRHQASRRKSYGRRQHEVRERTMRHGEVEPQDERIDSFGMTGRMEALGLELNPGARRLGFAPAD